MEICPNCGQDLAPLRQLLKDFYEEPNPFEEPGWVSTRIIEPPKDQGSKTLPSDQPRVIFNSPPDELTRKLALHEPMGDDETWQQAPAPSQDLQDLAVLFGGFWLRSIAFVIDLFLILLTIALFMVVGFIALEVGMGTVRNFTFFQKLKVLIPVLCPWGAIFGVAYFTFCQGAWGQTLGKMIFGLRVIRKDGEPLGFGRALARTFFYLLSGIPFFLGFLWIALSPEKRGWHDRMAGTIVIRD